MLGNGRAAETFEHIFALFGLFTQPRDAANREPASELRSACLPSNLWLRGTPQRPRGR